MNQRAVIPIYTSRGDAEAFLCYPYIYNRIGEWIGWATADRQIYSVLGVYVGDLTAEPRILRKRITSTLKPRKMPPPHPPKLAVPATIPLAPLMADLRFGTVDVLLEEPERLHTTDAGELRQDMD
ncbi:MAG: hypothetical protein AB1531_03750 [Chloroflexota bacterium]